MTFTSPHNVLVLFGTQTSETDVDEWTCTLRFGDGGDPISGISDPAALDVINDDIEADLTTWWNAISTNFATDTKFLGFKFNAVGVDGRYVSQTLTNVRDFGSVKTGASGTGMLPAQCAVAVTLHTAAARGLASKGRIYLPAPQTGALSGGGRLSDTRCVELASATATLLTSLSNWPGLDSPDLGSAVVASKVGAGGMRRITGVSVGDRIDVQRRRANKFRENRSPISGVTT